MSQQEEQPRPSLRLRKTPDRPPDAPPDASKAEPPKPDVSSETPAETASRPRLSTIIRPGSAGTTPSAPPAPPPAAPEPIVPQQAPATPAPAFEPLPAPVAKAEPIPSPIAEAPKPPISAPIPVAAPPTPPPVTNPRLPVVEPPRPLHFPQPPEAQPEAKAESKPPSPRAVGLVMFGVIILVLGGLAYVLFLDPFGLFNRGEPEQAAAPAVTAPAATAPAPAPAQPAAVTAAQPATPAPVEEAPEFKMPEPAPLVAGEEIAPGVVRLPPDAAAVSMPESGSLPEPRAYEPPAPKPNPAYTALVNNLNISGIRANSSGGYLMIGTLLYKPGDIVDVQSKLEFVSIDGPVITFKDPAGALYTRRF